ncbi:MAG: electron transfer flavoprotein subunit alpha/FixB family protein [Bacillota bacterium]
MPEIMIVAGRDRKLTLELIGAAQRIAPALGGARVTAVVLGPEQSLPVQVIYHGASPLLAEYQPDLALTALEAVAKEFGPDLILFGHDEAGQELGPRLAARLKAGCVTDAVGLSVSDGRLQMVRPVFGGKAIATYTGRRSVQVVTLRARTQEPAADGPSAPEVIPVGLVLDGSMGLTRVLEQIREATAGLRLEEARVVVAGGRGLGGAEGFEQLQRLAAVLGGAVGASRAAVDGGWCPTSWQIGQTGKMVAPDLYIAVGISGASQHLAGIANAKTVVAINKDPEAPIFKRATLGVVGDYKAVLPALTHQFELLLAR